MKQKVKTRFPSFLDIIAGSAGGGAIILGLIILILVLVNRSVLLKGRCITKKHQLTCTCYHIAVYLLCYNKNVIILKISKFRLPKHIMNDIKGPCYFSERGVPVTEKGPLKRTWRAQMKFLTAILNCPTIHYISLHNLWTS